MILVRNVADGHREVTDLTDTAHGASAFLVGGGPSLRNVDTQLLQQPGIATMAMNNAALHIRPTWWVCSDDPRCFATRILLDPGIMKFAPHGTANRPIREGKRTMDKCPNTLFYVQGDPPTWDRYLQRASSVPWYQNTMLSAIHILYQLGIRHIYLLGSELGQSADGRAYAHDVEIGSLEKKWSQDVYNALAEELRRLKPHFYNAGLTLTDCSTPSRIGQTYRTLSVEDAVQEILEPLADCDEDDQVLPHCSAFADYNIKQAIAQWPGHIRRPEGPVQDLIPHPGQHEQL